MAKTSHKKFKIVSGLLLLGVIFFGIVASVLLSQQKVIEPPSFASMGACSGDPEADNNGCVNGGGIENGCNWICQSPDHPPTAGARVPSCCEEVKRTGDPTLCCFDALRRCNPDQCGAIAPEDRQNCNGPCRCGQLWALGWNCSLGGNSQAPSSTPRPTSNEPTRRPTTKPTRTPRPSNTPIPPTVRPGTTVEPSATSSPNRPTTVPVSTTTPANPFPTLDDAASTIPLPRPETYSSEDSIFNIPNAFKQFLSTFLFGYNISEDSSSETEPGPTKVPDKGMFEKTQESVGETWGFFIDLTKRIAP